MSAKIRTYFWVFAAVLATWLMLAESGFAQTPEWYNELNQFQQQITFDWRNRAFNIGVSIFFALAVLDLVVFGIGLKFSDKSIDPVNTSLKKLVTLVFLFAIIMFFWLLEALVLGFQEIAFTIYGAEMDLNEFQIISAGLWFFNAAYQSLQANYSWVNILSLSASFSVFFLLFALAGFVVLAIQYAYITMEVLIALTFSPLFLGFLPMKFTRVYSERYISYIFHLGVKVFLFYMIFYFFWSVLMMMVQNVYSSQDFGWHVLLSIGFFSFLAIFVLAKIPGKMSQFITENQNLDLGKVLNRMDEL